MLRTKLMNSFLLLIGQQGAIEGISSRNDESELDIIKGSPAEKIFCRLDWSEKVWSWGDQF